MPTTVPRSSKRRAPKHIKHESRPWTIAVRLPDGTVFAATAGVVWHVEVPGVAVASRARGARLPALS